jgi:hypothetical protein
VEPILCERMLWYESRLGGSSRGNGVMGKTEDSRSGRCGILVFVWPPRERRDFEPLHLDCPPKLWVQRFCHRVMKREWVVMACSLRNLAEWSRTVGLTLILRQSTSDSRFLLCNHRISPNAIVYHAIS